MAKNDERDDEELDEIAALQEPDQAILALRETDPEKASQLELERLRKANERLLNRQRRDRLAGYTEKLVTDEFPFAAAELIQGETKAEIRKSAERLHNANVALLKSLGLTPEQIQARATAAGGGQTTSKADEGDGKEAAQTAVNGRQPLEQVAKSWGTPPAAASEAVASSTVPDWDELKGKATRGEISREDLQAELSKNGPRVIIRPGLGQTLAERYGNSPRGKQGAN